jgi:hypothetical protein
MVSNWKEQIQQKSYERIIKQKQLPVELNEYCLRYNTKMMTFLFPQFFEDISRYQSPLSPSNHSSKHLKKFNFK